MKRKPFFVILFLSILALPLLACLLFSQARLVVKPEAVSQVDELLDQMARDGTFSGSALIAQDGVVYLSKGYGLADRLQGIPNTPQTRFHLGSMTKQFTAMGILILESQGSLHLQDSICNFIAGCPTAWQGVTIHHLLTHTSGLSIRLSSKLYGVIDRGTSEPVTPAVSPVEQADYLGLTSEWPVGTQPGEKFTYNNFGYIILSHIIEEVSGQSYADFLEQTIFTPLNMHNTGYPDSSSGMASIYSDRDTLEGTQFGPGPISDGSDNLYSTCEDLLLWDQALDTDHLLPREKLDLMLTPFVRQSPIPGFGYGYGWFLTKIMGRPLVLGTGGGPSFVTVYFRLPADGLTLIVLTNQGAPDFFSMMVAIVLGIAGALFLSDLVFALSAIAFLLLLALLLAAQKNHRVKTTWVIGILWSLLAAPLALVFARYLAEGRGVGTLLSLSLVLLFMLVKALLDFVFRMDFRRNRITHLATLALMCLALFSLIWIAFSIHPTWGISVLIAFGILAISWILMYRNEISVTQ
jgi:CubicO group peptidase (beta-lactamase class C family)